MLRGPECRWLRSRMRRPLRDSNTTNCRRNSGVLHERQQVPPGDLDLLENRRSGRSAGGCPIKRDHDGRCRQRRQAVTLAPALELRPVARASAGGVLRLRGRGVALGVLQSFTELGSQLLGQFARRAQVAAASSARTALRRASRSRRAALSARPQPRPQRDPGGPPSRQEVTRGPRSTWWGAVRGHVEEALP